MDYRNPETRDALAAEYVLGTLHGRARRRFERLMAVDAVLRQAVERWQDTLYPLIEALPDRKPPARVWQTVQRQITPSFVESQRIGLWENLTFWRNWGLLASALAIGMAIYLVLAVTRPAAVDYVAVINDGIERTTWLVRIDQVGNQLNVQTLRPQELTADRSFELWLLPGGGKAPLSMGLIPAQGEVALPLAPALADMLTDAEGFAVSLEPLGGSPTGQPTGPVLYQGLMIPPA